MKKLMLVVAGALVMGGVALYAQDNTGTTGINESTQKVDQTNTQNDPTQTMDQTNTQNDRTKTLDQSTKQTDQKDYSMKAGQDQSMKGWTKVNSADLPASLRTTLGGSEYTGWEKSSVYVNQAGDRYSLRLGDAASPKSYYFDKTGKSTEGISSDPESLNKDQESLNKDQESMTK